jgi:hypothetical protein
LPANYTFTAADAGVKTFTVTLSTAGSRTVTVNDTVNASITAGSVAINVLAPTARFTVTSNVASILAGGTATITVKALDSNNSVTPWYTGAVRFSSTDVAAGLPANYTFTAADAGVKTFTVTLSTAGSRTVTVNDTGNASITAGSVAINVLAPTTRLQITNTMTVNVGGTFTITVKAVDASGAVTPWYTGTVRFGSSDISAGLPANYAFAGADAGIRTFDVTLQSAGSQTIAVTDTTNSAITGTTSINVVPNILPNQAPTVATPATASTVVSAKSNLTVLAADDKGEANLRYTWTSVGPAAVALSTNGTNSSKSTTATFSKSGTYAFTVTIVDGDGLSVTSSVNVEVRLNQTPTVKRKALAAPFVVVGKTTRLSAVGADDGGNANLRYTWSAIGPAAVKFSANNSFAAWNVGVTFSSIGSYLFTVKITDQDGASVISSVYVVVLPSYANFWPVYWQVVSINKSLR